MVRNKKLLLEIKLYIAHANLKCYVIMWYILSLKLMFQNAITKQAKMDVSIIIHMEI